MYHVREVDELIASLFHDYNWNRRHSSLKYMTPRSLLHLGHCGVKDKMDETSYLGQPSSLERYNSLLRF
ncbi:MAG: integrase core domain-containing protein [Nitrososphaerales archaeon]